MAIVFRASLFAFLASLCLAAVGDDEPQSTSDATQTKKEPASVEKRPNQAGKKKAKAGETKKQQSTKPATDEPKPAKAKKQAADAEREEAVFVLVRDHYPDLVELLKRLKGTKQKEYQQAVKELYRDSQRLEAARRDPERYELELRAWQLDSRIRLLAAKLSIEDRPELEQDLKAALAERADVRLAQKKLDRERLNARIEKLNQEIDKFASTRDDELQRTFDRLVRTARKARPEKKPAAEEKPVTDVGGAATPSNQPTKPETEEVKPKD